MYKIANEKKYCIKDEKAVTLIALVVTVIVLIILAGVSITALVGEKGLIKRSKDSKELTRISSIIEVRNQWHIDKEEGPGYISLEELTQKMLDDKLITSDEKSIIDTDGHIVLKDNDIVFEYKPFVKIGDYVDYIPDTVTTSYGKEKLPNELTGVDYNTGFTQNKLKWQVLNINTDGSIDLVASPTEDKLALSSYEGYNNGVYLMNDICKTLYSRGNIIARSINIEDVERHLTENGKKERDAYESYGVKRVFSSLDRHVFPALFFEEENAGLGTLKRSESNGLNYNEFILELNHDITVTSTYFTIDINENNFGEGYKPLYGDGKMCFVASRMIAFVSSDKLTSYGFYDLNGYYSESSCFGDSNGTANNWDIEKSLRPVVTLPAGTEMVKCNGINSESNMHTINWN